MGIFCSSLPTFVRKYRVESAPTSKSSAHLSPKSTLLPLNFFVNLLMAWMSARNEELAALIVFAAYRRTFMLNKQKQKKHTRDEKKSKNNQL